MSPFDALVGTWIVEAGPVSWMLELRPDGGYQAALGGSDARHWGAWLLDARSFNPVLVLHHAGAFPLVQATPYGLRPVAWAPVEAWPILSIMGGSLLFQGGATARKVATDATTWPGMPGTLGVPQAAAPPSPAPRVPVGPPGGAAPNAASGFSGVDQALLDASKANAAAMEKARHEAAQAYIRVLQMR